MGAETRRGSARGRAVAAAAATAVARATPVAPVAAIGKLRRTAQSGREIIQAAGCTNDGQRGSVRRDMPLPLGKKILFSLLALLSSISREAIYVSTSINFLNQCCRKCGGVGNIFVCT